MSTGSAISARAQLRAYFSALPPNGRRALQTIRRAIREVAPKAEEGFSYRIPCFKFEGRILVWYAAFKSHCSLYPITATIRRTHAAALEGYQTSKGTVRFPLAKPIPVPLVRRLVRARIAALRARRAS